MHNSFCTCVIIKSGNGIAENTEAAAKQHLKYMACVDGSDLAHEGYKVAAAFSNARKDLDPLVACMLEANQRTDIYVPLCFRPANIMERYTEANQTYAPGRSEVQVVQRNKELVPKQLQQVADASGAVFIVLGSRGLSGGEAAMGSVANYILKKGHACVIIVKANENGCKKLFFNDPEDDFP